MEEDDTNQMDIDQLTSSQPVESVAKMPNLDRLLKSIMFPVIKLMSFIQEIESRKWVYHGIYLESFPRIYYSILDEYLFQDLSLIQVILCSDSYDA